MAHYSTCLRSKYVDRTAWVYENRYTDLVASQVDGPDIPAISPRLAPVAKRPRGILQLHRQVAFITGLCRRIRCACAVMLWRCWDRCAADLFLYLVRVDGDRVGGCLFVCCSDVTEIAIEATTNNPRHAARPYNYQTTTSLTPELDRQPRHPSFCKIRPGFQSSTCNLNL